MSTKDDVDFTETDEFEEEEQQDEQEEEPVGDDIQMVEEDVVEIPTVIVPSILTTRSLVVRIFSGERVAQTIRMSPDNWNRPRIGNCKIDLDQGIHHNFDD